MSSFGNFLDFLDFCCIILFFSSCVLYFVPHVGLLMNFNELNDFQRGTVVIIKLQLSLCAIMVS